MNSKAKLVGAIIDQAYLDNMPLCGSIFILSKKTIWEIEGEEFAKSWEEMKRPFYIKCAEDAMKVASGNSPMALIRFQEIMKNPEIAGYPDKTEYMYSEYVFLLCYYILYGKKGKAIHAVQIDALCEHTMKTWFRMWETNYDQGNDLYMGRTNEPLPIN